MARAAFGVLGRGREVLVYGCVVFFFFSSRRRHTRLQGDWSSDVCSSDLRTLTRFASHFRLTWRWRAKRVSVRRGSFRLYRISTARLSWSNGSSTGSSRSEERRVGKEGRSRWAPYH